MNKSILYISLMFIIGCESPQKSNGFAKGSENSWKIGSQAGVDLVSELDKAWSSQDYEKMKMFLMIRLPLCLQRVISLIQLMAS